MLGYGHIGREIARLLKAHGMDVAAATRSGKKTGIGGFLVEGTGDHDGGAFDLQPLHLSSFGC